MKEIAADSIPTGRPVAGGAGWRYLVTALGVLVAFIVIASVGYRLIESEYTLLDAVYMTVISVSTVGYGEVGQLSQALRGDFRGGSFSGPVGCARLGVSAGQGQRRRH